MKWQFAAGFVSLMTALSVSSQPIPLYENFGFNDYGATPPQIDALAFANYGTFNVTTSLPFDTQNTLSFTNRGVMANAFTGFEFDTAFTDGARRRAAFFINDRDASISAGRHIRIDATNIVNRGQLRVGGSGLLSIRGERVDLSRSVIIIPQVTITGGASENRPPNDFTPSPAIFDNYWGAASTNFNSQDIADTLIQSGDYLSPPHDVTNSFGFSSLELPVPSPSVYTFTNSITSDTNTTQIIQMAFIYSPDTNIVSTVSFQGRDPLKIINVSFTRTSTNVFGESSSSGIYIQDHLAVVTNTVALTNDTTGPVFTYRPAAYMVSRVNPFSNVIPGNAPFTPDYIYNTNYLSTVVTNIYAAYSGIVIDQVDPEPVPGSSSGDYPGRIEIVADTLNLSNARIQAGSYMKIDAKHLEDSRNLNVQGQRLSYSLSSTNGTLRVRDLVKSSVPRFFGEVYMYSSLWTNQLPVVVTNITPDPVDPALSVTNVATNNVDYILHTFAIYSDMRGSSEVFVDDLFLRSTNMHVFDVMTVTNGFRLDGQNFTLEPAARLNMVMNVSDWRSTNSPNLLNLTNHGELNVANNLNWGADRVQPFNSIVNSGEISSASQVYKVKDFYNYGTLVSQARITIDAENSTLDSGLSQSGSDTLWTGGGVKLRQYQMTAGRGLFINLDSYLEDSGPDAGNTLIFQDGIHLAKLPARGNLLGTTIRTFAPNFASVNHTWAGLDVGASPAGFTNNTVNVPIRRLELNTAISSELVFTGTGTANALYVDYLSLPVGINRLADILKLADNMVIYFADSNIPAEELDGQLGGKLRWVRDYAGPESGMDILLANGSVIRVNRNVRSSLAIDSDADGVPNGLDDTPYDGVAIASVSVTTSPALAAQITWVAASQVVYTVEYATNTVNGTWQTLTKYTNSFSTNTTATVVDPITEASDQRYYRVTYTP